MKSNSVKQVPSGIVRAKCHGEYYVTKEGDVYNKHYKLLKTCTYECGRKKLHAVEDGNLKQIYVHRIIYETFIGIIPDGLVVDHIDMNPSNNNINNLRAVTIQHNSWNNKAIGVCWDTSHQTWKAYIRVDGMLKSKCFKNKEYALQWRANMKKILHSIPDDVPAIY